MWREVFWYASNPEVFLDEANLRSLLVRAGVTAQHALLHRLDKALAGLDEELEASRATWTALLSRAGSEQARAALLRIILAQSAPLGVSLGAWIQGLIAPVVFEDEIHLKLLALLADDIGAGRPEASRSDAFRLLARRHGRSDLAATPGDLAGLRTIDDEMFRIPAVVCALSRRSDAFASELVGIDLAFRSIGLMAAWAAGANFDGGPEWARLDLSTAQGVYFPAHHTPPTLSHWIAERYEEDPHLAARVCDGIQWMRRGLGKWNRELYDRCCAALSPRLAMASFVQARARVASAYHHDVKLEGKSIAEWFHEAATDPLPFVDAIGRSWLVRPREPDRSPLISNLVQPGGAMFRIFGEEDLVVIRRWIESLQPGAQEVAAAEPEIPLKFEPSLAPPAFGQGDVSVGREPKSIRDAYFLLQGRALAPRTRVFAVDYVRFWLAPSRNSVDRTDRSLPATWFPGRLRSWLHDAHDKQAGEFQRHRQDESPARGAIIEQTLQLAPLILIDGAWLQGFTDVTLASTRIGSPLFNTFWDELGNGEYEINHHKIYRDVLRAMGIELQPTGSRSFAFDERLWDSSFRLPVYWLCLGKLPTTFMPEILGMNLAMELSGVGGTYRTAHRFLKHHGFPTIFVDVHNTIDNVETGHSAWAADAIDAYMQTVPAYADPDIAWERVRAGYESLSPIVKGDADLDYFRR